MLTLNVSPPMVTCHNPPTVVQANETFLGGSPEQALVQYNAALHYVDEELLFQLDGPHLTHAHAARMPILLNMAACQLQLEQWPEAEASATEALSLLEVGDTSCRSKALYRRAVARRALRQTDAAAVDLHASLELCALPAFAVLAFGGGAVLVCTCGRGHNALMRMSAGVPVDHTAHCWLCSQTSTKQVQVVMTKQHLMHSTGIW
jgi:hypothetical protein